MRTKGQEIVADYEADIIAQPYELAAAIDAAIAACSAPPAPTQQPDDCLAAFNEWFDYPLPPCSSWVKELALLAWGACWKLHVIKRESIDLEKCAIAAYEAHHITENAEVPPGPIWFDTARAVLKAAGIEGEKP
jgi:hypothetical protein